MTAEEKERLRGRGTFMTVLKDALRGGCPPPPAPPLGQKWKVLVNDVFCVKLGVTGEEPLNPTLLGLFPLQPSAGSCVVVCVCVSHHTLLTQPVPHTHYY